MQRVGIAVVSQMGRVTGQLASRMQPSIWNRVGTLGLAPSPDSHEPVLVRPCATAIWPNRSAARSDCPTTRTPFRPADARADQFALCLTLWEALYGQRPFAGDDLEAIVQALPPDPRGGSVEVRAGQFSARPGALDYNVVLMRDGSPRKALSGVVQLTVSGESARGAPTTLALEPIALSMLGHEVVRGSAPLPEGFKPRQTTVQVLDKAAGKSLGMRVLLVR